MLRQLSPGQRLAVSQPTSDLGTVVDGDDMRLGERLMTLHDTNEQHRQARSFHERELRALSAAERENTVVCTHYWPTLRPFTGPDGQPPADRYITGSDLDALIAECGPRLWLCGHAHTTHHVTIGNTEISSNPRAGDGLRGRLVVGGAG
jgi:Icc-related predicted phosphoesterase